MARLKESINAACNAFFARRGMIDQPSFNPGYGPGKPPE
jgi:hypothetical protein